MFETREVINIVTVDATKISDNLTSFCPITVYEKTPPHCD
jgi:hypothetical protein